MGSNSEYKSDEIKWVKNIQKGDHASFKELFQEYYFLLTRFAWRYVKSKAVAEELVQDVFADIWEERESWEIEGSLRAYLYKVVKNNCLDYLKHQKIEKKYDSRWMDQKKNTTIEFQDELREREVKNAIEQAIEALPPRAQMTYKLHRFDGLTYEEIGEVMNISVKTVESQMTRTLKKLREHLSHLLPTMMSVITSSLLRLF